MSAQPSLFDDFEHLGDWWLPQSPKERLSGVLTVKRGEPRLVVMGVFPGAAESLKTRNPLVPDIIHGEAGSGGIRITLYNSIPVVTSFGPGPSRTEYVCSSAAIGDHFKHDATFANVAVSLTGLDAWSGHIPFVEKPSLRGPKKKHVSLGMSFRRPRPAQVSLKKHGLTVTLDFSLDTSGSMHQRHWSYETYIQVTDTVPRPIAWCSRVRDKLGSVLALLVGEPVWAKHIRLLSKAGTPAFLYQEERGAAERQEPNDVLFPFYEFKKGGVTQTVRRCFDLLSDFRPTIDLYLGTLYPPSSFIEFEFLALTQALESYHRRRFDGRYLKDADYEALVETMRNAIPAAAPEGLRPPGRCRARSMTAAPAQSR